MTPGRLDATTVAAAVRAGRRTATEVVTERLEAAARLQDDLNVFTRILTDDALRSAAEVDRAVAAGDDPGPLAGVPIVVKDLIDQTGVPTTNGSSFPAEPAKHTAPAVTRLTDAGAVVIGRTGLHEFAFGFSSENHWFGPVRNPWNPATSPGGSSGGSGAAVGAGLVPIALGTDTGGSIRVPAALCGAVGLKVSHGRISIAGVTPLAASFDTIGPIAGSIGDAARSYVLMAGFDPGDPWSLPVEVRRPGPPPDVRMLRVGVPHPWTDLPLSQEVAAGWTWFRTALIEAGAQVIDLEVAELEYPGLITEAMYPEVAAVHRTRFSARPDGYGPEVRDRIAATLDSTMEGYLEGLAWRRRLREAAHRALSECDVLATPSVATLRKTIGIDTVDLGGETVPYRTALSCFSALVNPMGMPALSAPLGRQGAPPPSVQLIAPMWEEHRLLEIGEALTAVGILDVPAPPEIHSVG